MADKEEPKEGKVAEDLKGVAGAIEGVAKACPVYQDLLQPGIRRVGVALEELVDIPLSLVTGTKFLKDAAAQQLKEMIAAKLCTIPPERRIEPDPLILVPAIQALAYSAHHEPLRALYLNLLRSSMDTRTAATTLPAFTEILRQITPDEAKILRWLEGDATTYFAVVSIKVIFNTSYYFEPIKHLSDITIHAECDCPELVSVYLTNLERLGLIETFPDHPVTNEPNIDKDAIYSAIITATGARELLEGYAAHGKPIFHRYSGKATELYRAFAGACILEPQ